MGSGDIPNSLRTIGPKFRPREGEYEVGKSCLDIFDSQIRVTCLWYSLICFQSSMPHRTPLGKLVVKCVCFRPSSCCKIVASFLDTVSACKCSVLDVLRIPGGSSQWPWTYTKTCSIPQGSTQPIYWEVIQPKDEFLPFFNKCPFLVASKFSLEVLPFCKTQANSECNRCRWLLPNCGSAAGLLLQCF